MPKEQKIFTHLWYAQEAAELDRYWNALLGDGGPPRACGGLIDRFGLRWHGERR